MTGLPCPKDQVCNLVNPTCSVSNVAGFGVSKPDACLQIYDPVCGCDGISYGNNCKRLRAGATLTIMDG